MSRPPYVPFPQGLGDLLRPGDPRSPAMKVRCKRAVETLLADWEPRGRPREVSWHLLSALGAEAGRRLRFWVGLGLSRRVLERLIERLQSEEYALRVAGTPAPFLPPCSAEAPPAALARIGVLFDEISTWSLGRLPPKHVAWAFVVAVLEETWLRFGPAAAAEVALWALIEGTLVPPPARRPEARP